MGIFFQEYAGLIFSSLVGSLGFCLVFHIKKNKLIYGCVGGLLSIIVYFICEEIGMTALVQNMIAAIVATLYAEVLARIVKAPSTVFLIPSIIPLIPGSLLYYTMRAVVDGDLQAAKQRGEETLLVALGIAVGIVLISVIFYQISHKDVQLKVSYGTKENKNKR